MSQVGGPVSRFALGRNPSTFDDPGDIINAIASSLGGGQGALGGLARIAAISQAASSGDVGNAIRVANVFNQQDASERALLANPNFNTLDPEEFERRLGFIPPTEIGPIDVDLGEAGGVTDFEKRIKGSQVSAEDRLKFSTVKGRLGLAEDARDPFERQQILETGASASLKSEAAARLFEEFSQDNPDVLKTHIMGMQFGNNGLQLSLSPRGQQQGNFTAEEADAAIQEARNFAPGVTLAKVPTGFFANGEVAYRVSPFQERTPNSIETFLNLAPADQKLFADATGTLSEARREEKLTDLDVIQGELKRRGLNPGDKRYPSESELSTLVALQKRKQKVISSTDVGVLAEFNITPEEATSTLQDALDEFGSVKRLDAGERAEEEPAGEPIPLDEFNRIETLQQIASDIVDMLRVLQPEAAGQRIAQEFLQNPEWSNLSNEQKREVLVISLRQANLPQDVKNQIQLSFDNVFAQLRALESPEGEVRQTPTRGVSLGPAPGEVQ